MIATKKEMEAEMKQEKESRWMEVKPIKECKVATHQSS
jgi:hypothetical protein